MALNEVFKEGIALSLPVPDGTLSGKPLRIGVLNAVAQTDEGGATAVINGITQITGGVGNADNFASVSLVGAWELDVAGAVATVGQAIYFKTSDGSLTATSTGNFLFGAALRTKGTGTGPLVVKLLQPGQTVASA